MKKLLTLLFLSTILFSCGSDDTPNSGGGDNGKGTTTQLGKTTNPIPESEWKGESPQESVFAIDGDWILTHENGNATNQFLVYQFGGKLWYNLKKKPSEGETPSFTNWLSYTCNTGQIKEDKTGLIYTYKTSSDLSSMTLFDGSNTWVFKKYDNNGVWKWNGDWNDKSSPYFAVYNGQYNPVKGEWKNINNSDNIFFQDIYYKFDDDFGLYRKILYNESYDNVNYTFLSGYKINGISLYTTQYDFLGYQYQKYWIEGDILYLQGVYYPNTLKDTTRLTRVK